MSEFRTALEVRLLPENDGGPRWQLISPLVYYSDVMNREIIVPIGFVSDFVSFCLLKNVGHRASVVHDWMYESDVDRELADKVLREALCVSGVPDELSEDMYLAVRLCGRRHKVNLHSL